MLKKFAQDALGLSDIGKIIAKEDFDKTDIDDYIFHEDGEEIFFVIKSKKDEYCFTNTAFIHLDGESAVSSKRTLKRYDYRYNEIDEVTLETAGTIDLDCEIKFMVDGDSFSIDVDKKQVELLKDLYKSLIAISTIQDQNKKKLRFASQAQDIGTNIVRDLRLTEGTGTLELYNSVRSSAMDFMLETHEKYDQVDFKDVFTKYLSA